VGRRRRGAKNKSPGALAGALVSADRIDDRL